MGHRGAVYSTAISLVKLLYYPFNSSYMVILQYGSYYIASIYMTILFYFNLTLLDYCIIIFWEDLLLVWDGKDCSMRLWDCEVMRLRDHEWDSEIWFASHSLYSAESTACFCIYGTPMTPIINIPPTSPYLYSRRHSESRNLRISTTKTPAIS